MLISYKKVLTPYALPSSKKKEKVLTKVIHLSK